MSVDELLEPEVPLLPELRICKLLRSREGGELFADLLAMRCMRKAQAWRHSQDGYVGRRGSGRVRRRSGKGGRGSSKPHPHRDLELPYHPINMLALIALLYLLRRCWLHVRSCRACYDCEQSPGSAEHRSTTLAMPSLLWTCRLQAAALGQQGIDFAREVHAIGDSAGEDIQGLVMVDGVMVPLELSEVKPCNAIACPDDPVSGINNNADAFGKVCMRVLASGDHILPAENSHVVTGHVVRMHQRFDRL